MITLKIYWWYLPLILFLLPFVFLHFYDDSSGYLSIDIIPILVVIVCWIASLSILIGVALKTFL